MSELGQGGHLGELGSNPASAIDVLGKSLPH